MVPYADFNLLKFPDKATRRWRRSRTSPCCPTSSRPATTARHRRRRPGLARCTSPAPARSAWPAPPRPPARRGRRHRRRHDHERLLKRPRASAARPSTCEDRRRCEERSSRSSAAREVDCAVDCVGFEARGHGKDASQRGPRHRAQLDHGRHPRRRALGHPGPLRHRRPGRHRQPTPRSARSASASASAGPRATASRPASAR